MRYLRRCSYFLKDIVWWLFIFGIGFLFGMKMTNANALTTYNYGNLYEKFKNNDYNFQFNDQTVNIKEDVEHLNNVLKNSGMNYIVIFETGNPGYSKFQPKLYITEYTGNSTTFEKNSNDGSEWYTFGRSNTSGYVYLSNTNSNEFHSGIEELIEYINTNKHIPKTNLSYVKYDSGRYFNVLTADSIKNINGHFFMYDTNMTVKMINLYGNAFMINDQLYQEKSNLPSYKEVYSANIYNVNEIDHIEVEFDLNHIPESTLIPGNEDFFKFEMTYDIKTVTDSTGNVLSKTTLDVPRIEYILGQEDGTQNISKYGLSYMRQNQYNKYFDKDSYTNQYFAKYDYPRSLKLLINCRDINDVYLYLKLKSNLNYKIKVYFRDQIEDYQKYYKEVDITNKYAVLFIPKIRIDGNQNSVSSYFISNGDFKVEERDNFTNDFNLYKDPVIVRGNNQYYYFYTLSGILHKNDSFYYRNLNYSTDVLSTIKYDSRYFVTSICKNEFECETIENPNTGEIITPTPPHDKDEWSFDNLVKRVKDFIDDLHAYMDPISESIQYFYNNLPSIFQNFLIVIYVVLLLFAIIKVLRS